MRNEVRIFGLDRIKMLHQTKETFAGPEDFSLENFMGSSFGVYQGEPVYIKVWFHPDVAGYIKEKIWRELQKIHQQDDGSIIFEAQVAGTDEIRFWIMTWGSKAEALEPESLGEEIRIGAERMAKRYEGTIVAEEMETSKPFGEGMNSRHDPQNPEKSLAAVCGLFCPACARSLSVRQKMNRTD